MEGMKSRETARRGQYLTLPSSMLELEPHFGRQLFWWTMIAPIFFIPVTGLGPQVNFTLPTTLGDMRMGMARTVVRLLVTLSHFDSQVRWWGFQQLGAYFVTGTAVSVYGIFASDIIGVLSATFTVDDGTVLQTHNVTPITIGSDRERPNFPYYSLDNLAAGDHTLIVNVTVADNHSFVLDYITYTPSFDTVLSMPLFNNTTTIGPTSTIKSSTSLGSPSPKPSKVENSTSPIRTNRTATIVSAVMGVLAIVLVAILGRWVFLRWRKPKKPEGIPLEHSTDGMLRITLLLMRHHLNCSRSRQLAHTKSQ